MKKRIARSILQAPVRWSIRAVGCVGLFFVTACGGGAGVSVATGSIATSTMAVTTASLDANQAPSPQTHRAGDENLTLGMEHILPLLHLLPHEAAMSIHCDPNAAPEHIDVCGDEVPGAVQATWSSCQMHHPPMDADHHHGDFHMVLGMMPPPPWLGDANMAGDANTASRDPNAAAMDANGWHHGPRATNGTLTITASVTPDANTTCDANTSITAQRQATFTVRMGDVNGPTMVLTGTNSETMSQVGAHTAADGNLTLDLNRTVLDAHGEVLHSTVVSGTVQKTADSNQPVSDANAVGHPGHHHPMMNHVLNGTLTVNNDTVVLTGVTPRMGCMWPTAGTVVRTDSVGTHHTLVFSATCGSATLDGAVVTLPSHGPWGHPVHHPTP